MVEYAKKVEISIHKLYDEKDWCLGIMVSAPIQLHLSS